MVIVAVCYLNASKICATLSMQRTYALGCAKVSVCGPFCVRFRTTLVSACNTRAYAVRFRTLSGPIVDTQVRGPVEQEVSVRAAEIGPCRHLAHLAVVAPTPICNVKVFQEF